MKAIDNTEIELVHATVDDMALLRNLLELYLYNSSEYEGDDVTSAGLYGYRYLGHYWTEEGRTALLIRTPDQWAGFALVRRVIDDQGVAVQHMAEFFVMKRYRCLGVGRHVAQTIFARFPGLWCVQQVLKNIPAQRFWRKVIEGYSGGNYTETIDASSGYITQYFRATSKPLAA